MESGYRGIRIWWTFNNFCTMEVEGCLIGSDRITDGMTNTWLRNLGGVLVNSGGESLYCLLQLRKSLSILSVDLCLILFYGP